MDTTADIEVRLAAIERKTKRLLEQKRARELRMREGMAIRAAAAAMKQLGRDLPEDSSIGHDLIEYANKMYSAADGWDPPQSPPPKAERGRVVPLTVVPTPTGAA
jgi:hypothetical protein